MPEIEAVGFSCPHCKGFIEWTIQRLDAEEKKGCILSQNSRRGEQNSQGRQS